MRPIRMTPEDSAFWKMESDVSRMHSVTLTIFAGPAPAVGELEGHVAARVPLVPHFRHRVVEVPLDLGRPMWVEDADFDLANHLISASLTSGRAGLNELVSLILSEPLDRSKPLWELTVVTGLDGDGWALVSKVHHSMIDGLYGTEPLAVLMDGAVTDLPATNGWNPSRPPSANELLGRTIGELLFDPAEQYRFARASSRRNRRRFERLIGRGDRQLEEDPTGLRGPVGPARTWASCSIPMDTMRLARSIHGVNSHELVLAMVTTGLRDLLASREESGRDWPRVKAVVPVAVTGPSGDQRAATFPGGIAAEVVDLPTGQADPVARLRSLHQQAPSGESNPVAIGAQLDVGGFSTPALASLGLREATRRGVVEAGAQTVVVNVPGPTHRLTMLGRPMLELHPAPPLAGGVRVSIGVYSYLDTLTFGVTADRRSVASANVVIGGIRRALDELIDPKQETKNNANS